MSYTTGKADLRRLLSDGDQVKRAFQKVVIGPVDGINADFVTLENRYVPGSVDLYVDGLLVVKGTNYTEQDPVAGLIRFQPGYIPNQNAIIKASYYGQYFIDDDLDGFLIAAMSDLSMDSTDSTTIAAGLQSSLLHYAAANAYTYLATIWTQRIAEKFLAQDTAGVGDGQNFPKASHFLDLSKNEFTKAGQLRDDFYKRKGARETPVFGTLVGAVKETTPPR